MSYIVKLAGMCIQLKSDTPELKDFFKDYMVEGILPDFAVSWTEEEVRNEQNSCETQFSYSYLETLIALRKISEILPSHKRLLLHGACISYDDKAYLFTAPSGTGKSTHIRLWRRYLGDDVKIVNGDKPFVSLDESQPYIYGTPWAGKERWQRNCSQPLSAICFIQRGSHNTIRKISPPEALPLLFKQVYMPADPGAVGLTLELLDTLLKNVPLYLLECDISEDAVRCSFEAMTGLAYPSDI